MINQCEYPIKIGKSKRNITELVLKLGVPENRGEDNDWVIQCGLSGFCTESKLVEGRSYFDCLMCGAAYLRQMLRLILRRDKGLKLYFEFHGELTPIVIDDVFMTHDCIPEDMVIAYEWAKKNGYQSE